MKKFFRSLCIILLCTGFINADFAYSQSLPDFKMRLTNGKTFTTSNLSAEKPLVLIYFAPDCEHCQVLISQLLKKIDQFRNTQIIMVSFEPLQMLAAFKKDYQISKYPNITVGMELPVFFFRKYYNLQHTPFTALYNKNKKLIVSYKDYTPLDDLIKNVKNIKKARAKN